ncbi:MAG: hypothetical protein OXC11_09700 [Rhodospirillales bacterium]|nr:hypothetical protein [Rhodospirillales bacterium]
MSDERDDRKVRRGEKTVLDGHIPPDMPQWVRERIQRHMDRLYFNPPMPPPYRARYEGDDEDKRTGIPDRHTRISRYPGR